MMTMLLVVIDIGGYGEGEGGDDSGGDSDG